MATNDPATLLLWIDNPADAIIAADRREIVAKFEFIGRSVVVGASRRCAMYCGLTTWPDPPPLTPPQHGYYENNNISSSSKKDSAGKETETVIELPDLTSRWRYIDTSVMLADAAGFDALMASMPTPSLELAEGAVVTDVAANFHSLYVKLTPPHTDRCSDL